MPVISSVSDLMDYNEELEKVRSNSPVYITKNGHSAYSFYTVEHDVEYERMKAMSKLVTKLVIGSK